MKCVKCLSLLLLLFLCQSLLCAQAQDNGVDTALVAEVDDIIAQMQAAPDHDAYLYQSMLLKMGLPILKILQRKQELAPDPNINYVIGTLQLQAKQTEDTQATPAIELELEQVTVELDPEALVTFDNVEVQKYFRKKFEEAKLAFNNGNIDYAKRIAAALLLLDPAANLRAELRTFCIQCDEADIQDKYLRAKVVFEKNDYDFSDIIKITFKVQNISQYQLTLPGVQILAGKELPASVVHLELRCDEHDSAGNFKQKIINREWILKDDLILASGDEWEKVVEFNFASEWKNAHVLRCMTVNSWFRTDLQVVDVEQDADTVIVDEEAVIRRVVFPQISFRVFPVLSMPDGQIKSLVKMVQRSPKSKLELLKQAINTSESKPYEIFLIAHLQDRHELEGVINALVAALNNVMIRNQPAKQRACMAALARITGQQLQFDPARWTQWWDKNRAAFDSTLINPDFK